MKKKIILTVFLAFFALQLSFQTSSAQAYSYPDLNLMKEKVSPEPVRPGQGLTAKIRVINNGLETAENVSLVLDSDYPFYLKETSMDIGGEVDVCPLCSMDKTFYMQVATNATSGLYPIDFKIVRKGGKVKYNPKEDLKVKVIGIPDLNFDLERIKEESEEGEFKVKLRVTNEGTGKARNIKAIFGSEKIFPKGSNSYFIEELNSGEERKFKVEFLTKEGIEQDPYLIPVKFIYEGELGNRYNTTYNAGLNIGSEVSGSPNLMIKSSDIRVQQGENVEVNVSIENIGDDKASEIVVSNKNELISIQPSSMKIMELLPGEEVERKTLVEVDRDKSAGIQKLRFSLNYKDNSRTVRRTSDVPIKVLKVANLVLSDLNIKDSQIGKSTEAIIEVENEGPGEAKQIRSSLNCEGAVLKTEKSFVGQLDEDESVPMVFQITPQNSKVNCEITASYIDSEKRTISDSFSFTASEKPFPYAIAGVILLIAAGGIVYYWKKG